jgi:hypothetical protein
MIREFFISIPNTIFPNHFLDFASPALILNFHPDQGVIRAETSLL